MRPVLRAIAAGVLFVLPTTAFAQQTTWYLAEGSTGPFFEQEILAVNPNDQVATGVVTIYRDGVEVPVPFAIPGKRRITLPVNAVPGLQTGETSARITTDIPIFVERSMYWLGRRGGHNAAGVSGPSPTWYFSEGATGSFFHTFVLLVNPNPAPVDVVLTLQRDDGVSLPISYTLPAHSRRTHYINELTQQGFGSANFAIAVSASQPIFAERAMYWLDFEGGHDATGVTAPATTWRFAEGFIGGDFDTYFLVSNPGTEATWVTFDFFLDTGQAVTRMLHLAGGRRLTLRARHYPELENSAFATRISSTLPVVAERAMYWGGFQDGHATAGMTSEASKWIFAEGLAGVHGGQNYETFYLFMNASASPIDVTGTFYREDGYGSQVSFQIPANSRYTLYGAAVPHMNGQKFGAAFSGSANFIVERAVYWGPNRLGGHVSTGTPWTGAIDVPSAPPPPPPPPAAPEPPPPPRCTALVCDDLAGSTVGQQVGGSFDGFGYVIGHDTHGIRYVVQTIPSGYFEMEVTGMRVATWDDKWKIMGMYDGNGGWTSDDPYRFTVEHRYRPDRSFPWNRFLRLKVLNGSQHHGEYIETDTAASVNWNPSEVYTFRFEWGGGRARFIVRASNGTVVGHIDQAYGHGGEYAPPVHVLTVGNPIGGDHGSVPGLRVRNVRIGRN